MIPPRGFRFVSDHQADYPVALMCRVLGVSSAAMLVVGEAAAVAACVLRPRRGADRSDPCCAHSFARSTYGAPRVACRACRQGHFCWLQAGCAVDDAQAEFLPGVSRRKFVVTTVKDGWPPGARPG